MSDKYYINLPFKSLLTDARMFNSPFSYRTQSATFRYKKNKATTSETSMIHSYFFKCLTKYLVISLDMQQSYKM